MPLLKMLLLLTDGAAESLEPRSIPAPGAPLFPSTGSPSTTALPGAHGLTHGPGDGGVTFPAGLRVSDPNPKPLGASPKRHVGLMVTPQRDRGHPLGTAASATPQHHLLVAPASAASASKGVRWAMSGAAPPDPGLSPALATRCRGSPAAALVAAVSRDEEDAWKRSRTETQRRCLSGRGARGGSGLTDTKCFCFCRRPLHVATAGSGPWLPAQPDKESCRGGEDMNQSGVPSPAGGSWPLRQLPITQPGSVCSRSTTPPPLLHRLPCQAGEGNVLLGWGWHSRCALFGDSPLSSTPGRCSCHPPARAHSLGCHRSCLDLIKRQPVTPRSSQRCCATLGKTHGQHRFTGGLWVTTPCHRWHP